MQKTKLQEYFPMLKSREEIRKTIDEGEKLAGMFYAWEEKQQKEFLDFCSGARGVKMLYDAFAKAILDPEKYPERLNEILSLLLKKKVTIIQVLPNEGIRIAAEKSLLVMDIVVKLFSYRDMKNVYTIVFLEKSGSVFGKFPDNYLHYFEQESDTGLKLELLQKYIFVPIDIYLKNKENKDISNRLNAWLLFLGSDEYRQEMLIAAEGICVMAELSAKLAGYEIEPVTDARAWLDKYSDSWLRKNKPSELYRI